MKYWSLLLMLSCSCFVVSDVIAAVTDPVDLGDVAENVEPSIEHCEEAVASRNFIDVFECGDELFETRFNALDGVGMDVGDGGRFTRVPRADLSNWLDTIPARESGPNAEACNICHVAESIGGGGDGAGPAGLNVIRDPLQTGSPGSFVQRNAPHLFGMAGPQLLAEEMNADLEQVVALAIDAACSSNTPVTRPLGTKDVNFGSVTVTPPCPNPDVSMDVDGVDPDLAIKPFQWKGTDLTIRTFSRGAFHNELGMTPVELSGDGVDSDFDSVVDEITIADTTAMAIYLAAQPRPTSLTELSRARSRLERLGSAGMKLADELQLPELSSQQRRAINRGKQWFVDIGCANCHRPSLRVNNRIFTSPSQNPNYREETFPGGQDAIASGVDPEDPVSFDITRGQPDNIIQLGDRIITRLGSFRRTTDGGAVVELFGDLKRHDMGPDLAENIDEKGTGASVWMTKELWGLGSTAPYLHDGRATTIEEAIVEHGGEAATSQANFRALSAQTQDDVLAFLNNLVLYFPAEEE